MGVLEVQRGLLASEFWKNLKPYKCIVVKSSGIAAEYCAISFRVDEDNDMEKHETRR